jgi:hypothetical protein
VVEKPRAQLNFTIIAWKVGVRDPIGRTIVHAPTPVVRIIVLDGDVHRAAVLAKGDERKETTGSREDHMRSDHTASAADTVSAQCCIGKVDHPNCTVNHVSIGAGDLLFPLGGVFI